ncbi:MAG TPA: AI-2E family transporter [Dehalococcoidia bacterium]
MAVSVVRKRLRTAMVGGALLVVLYVLYAARGVLPPFLLGIVFVIVCGPIVDRLAHDLPFRRRHPDLALSVSIALVYFVLAGIFALIVVLIGPRLLAEGKNLASVLPSLVQRAQRELQDNSGWYQSNVPADIRTQIDQNWQQIANKLGEYGQTIFQHTINFATDSVTTLISYIVVPFWAFFVLKDRAKATRWFLGLFPAEVQPDVEHLLLNAQSVFGFYLRAQLLLATATGVVTTIGLVWFGVRFAVALGVIAGVANLIPVIGPMLGGIPALIVVLATHPGWEVLWVFLFLFVAQELKDFLLVPRIQGRAVRIHPAFILLLIVVAGHIAGFWGLLLVVPLAAVIRDTFVYIYRRLGQDPIVAVPTARTAASTAGLPPVEHDGMADGLPRRAAKALRG